MNIYNIYVGGFCYYLNYISVVEAIVVSDKCHLCENGSVSLSTGNDNSLLQIQAINRSWDMPVYRKLI